MEGCLPPMGAPCGYGLHGFAYGPGQTDDLWGGAAFWGHRDSSRKRSWDEEDSSAESRAVRQCVAGGEGGGLSGAVWHGSPSAHGISGLSGHGAFQQHFQHAHLQHHQHPREQPPPVAQRSQQQNAFQVLMSASPIKVDGIVCNRSCALVTCLDARAGAFSLTVAYLQGHSCSACVTPQNIS
jgi:hypothetical protein